MKRRCDVAAVTAGAAALVAALMVGVFSSCGSSEPASGPGEPSGGTTGFDTPEKVVEAFIAAGASRDVDALSECLSAGCESEFRPLKEKTASSEDLDGLAQLVQGGTVQGVDAESSEKAVVRVKFGSRDEQIHVEKTDKGWQIVAF